jgi:hypothetical protein
MDAKNVAEESPPPYTIHASDAKPTYQSSIDSIDSSSRYAESATSHLQHHLTSLPTRIRRTQQVHSFQRSLDDASLLDFLVPEVENFLAHIGNLTTTPKLAHLTLVPESAIPPNAVLSSMEELRRRGELCQVARVNVYPSHSNMGSKAESNRDKKKPETDEDSEGQTWTAGQEFSDWGRFGESSSSADLSSQAQAMLWWKDEDMARRLARHLQPERQTEQSVLNTPVQTIVEERLPLQKEKKSWFWGRKGSSSSSSSASAFGAKTVEKDVPAILPERSDDATDSNGRRNSNQKQKQQAGTKMTVTAEEVAFRTENNFGIMESKSGWAVVVVVHIRT